MSGDSASRVKSDSSHLPAKVFINYRSRGGSAAARALREELSRRLPGVDIIVDVDELSAAKEDTQLRKELSESDLLIAVVTPSWSDLKYTEGPLAGTRRLEKRGRQNVILELGFFYGYLGWENVFVLYKDADRVFPNFELPSDLDGVIFDRVENSGGWRQSLSERLAKAGFDAETATV